MQVATLTLKAIPVRVLTLALRSVLGCGPQEDSELELELNCGMEFGLWNGTGLLNGIGSWMKESYLVADILMLFVLLNLCCTFVVGMDVGVNCGVDIDTGTVVVGFGFGVGDGDGFGDSVYTSVY